MTLPSARLNIPDEWGKSAHCPICGASALNVLHPPQRPDEFQCPRCRAEFEVEQGGSRIWLNALPQDLHKTLAVRWVTFDEVKSEVERLKQQFEPPAKAPAVASPNIDDDCTTTSSASSTRPAICSSSQGTLFPGELS